MRILLSVAVALLLGGCSLLPRPPPTHTPPDAASPAGPAAGSAVPGKPAPSLPRPTTPPREFHLSPAASALVSQSHEQAQAGEGGQAAETLERALRIDPNNPLLWMELGRLQLTQGNPLQADSMGHKALALATGDATAQASAWQLIAEALKARGRNNEAAAAQRHAAAAAPH